MPFNYGKLYIWLSLLTKSSTKDSLNVMSSFFLDASVRLLMNSFVHAIVSSLCVESTGNA